MLEQVAKHHDLCIKMALNMTNDLEEAKDLVQDMYLVIHRRVKDVNSIMYKGDINRYFLWTVLRGLFIDKIRSKKIRSSITFEYLDTDCVDESVYDDGKDRAFEHIMKEVNSIVSTWKPYDIKLFDLYFMQGLSLRKIATGAGIGLSSIHISIRKYKKIMRENLSEDLQDYFNQDFDKIN